MKKLFLSLIMLTAIVCGGNAQLLWEITGNGIKKPSYIFGTHHLAPVSVLETTPGFSRALESVEAVYGEMDMASSQSPEAQQKIIAAAMAPADSTLNVLLTPAQLDSLDSYLKANMGPFVAANQFAALRPAMLSTMLTLAINQKIMPGFDPTKQIDTEIQHNASALGKDIKGFETIEEQCRALFGAPLAEEAEGLMEIVTNENKVFDLASRLSQAYLQGDLESMLAIMRESDDGADKGWEERMLNERNAKWVEVIAGLLPTASVLIAVGAGHLPGDKGLIELLREKGFTLKPVTE